MRAFIDRQRYLIDYALASMARRKTKNLGLLFLYTLVVFLLASVTLFAGALRREAAATLANAPDVIVQRLMAGRHDTIPASYLDKMGRLRGVRRQEGRLWGYYYDAALKANYTVMVPPGGAADGVASGRVVVGAALARRFGFTPGAVISFSDYMGKELRFTVAGVLPHESELLSADLVLMTGDDFRALFNYPQDQFTDIAIFVTNPREQRNVARKVVARLPDSRAILRVDILRTYDSLFRWREGLLLVMLAGSVLAFVIFALEKASGLPAEEKREIGILKAIGWETGDVIQMKFWEGALISFTAFLAGCTAAYWHTFHGGSALFVPVLKGWSVLYPSFDLHPTVNGFEVTTLFFFTVFPYALATVVPVWRAAVTDPDSVMRG